jgi:proline dehydrogenase
MLRNALLAVAASERIRELVTKTPAARELVHRYVAGESSEDAVVVARALRSAGLLVTLDYLGEDSTDAQRAAATAAQYVHLLGKLAAEGLTDGGSVEVSVKPTAVGLLLGLNEDGGFRRLRHRTPGQGLERVWVDVYPWNGSRGFRRVVAPGDGRAGRDRAP